MIYGAKWWLLLLSGFFGTATHAQQEVTQAFWARTHVWYAQGKQLYGIEWVCRQGEYQPILRGVRTWAQITVQKHWRIDLSPIAWFLVYQKTLPTTTWRTAAYMTYKTDFQGFEWQHRTGIETRYDTQKVQLQWLFRKKSILQLHFQDQWTVGIFDELFYPFQNRVGAFLQGHLWQKKFTWEVGGFYGKQKQVPAQQFVYTLTILYKYFHHSKKN